jgi:hypothetical protein
MVYHRNLGKDGHTLFRRRGNQLVKKCNVVDQLHFFIRIIHSAKLPGGKKGQQRKAEQIDMADTTGMDHNRFGMSVNQSTDVHAAGKKI